MADFSHQWSVDLTTGQTGDLATTSGPALTQQRLLRRLLTTPGDYIWQPDYGAGLAQLIGTPGDALRIRALIRSQIFKEADVARDPEPVIDVQLPQAGSTGFVYVQVRYVDASTGSTQLLSFPVKP